MDNAFVIDGALLAVLLAGTLLGARRGAVKSLMGLVTVAAALIGAVLLADLLTGPVTDAFVPEAVRALARGTVHAALVLAFYVALAVGLRLLTGALNLVFELPVLDAVNGALGALLGLAETALLLFVAVHVAARLNAEWIAPRAGGYLLPVFLSHSPVERISAWFR